MLKETIKNLKMSYKFLKNRKKVFVLTIFFSLILSLISILTPIVSAKILLNISSGLINDILVSALYIFIIEITRNIISAIYHKCNSYYMIKSASDIQSKLLEETLKIETSEIDKNSTGFFLDRINNDSEQVSTIFLDVAEYFIDFISNVGIMIAILYVNKWMFIYFCLTAFISWYISKKKRDKYYKWLNYRNVSKEKRSTVVTEVIRGIRDVKLLNANESILKKTNERIQEVNDESLKLENIQTKYDLISRSVGDGMDVAFFFLGAYLLYIGDLTSANFIILYMYKSTVERTLTIYNRMVSSIKSYNVSANRLYEIIENKFKKESECGIDMNLNGNIEFKNVSFAYLEDKVLNNVSFKINKGERVGFVGESGSGKSTIFNLITRLYKCEEGSITFDGVNINDISIKSIRDNISLIPQSPYIFNFTVKDNIKLSKEKVSDEEIIEASKKANIYDKIISLDSEFETYLGEGGVILSGGEKQRLAIARCLIKNSNIILFDEATSSLDNISQSKIQKAIYGFDKEKTILIIAHRLSTVVNCDKIIVVDKGKNIDIGTHRELLERCAKYKKLYEYENNIDKKQKK